MRSFDPRLRCLRSVDAMDAADAGELFMRHGIRLSHKTVAKLLRDHGYSLQAPNKSVEGAQHPDRNAQFEHINAKAHDCIERGIPVISVDTKKKELVGSRPAAPCPWHHEVWTKNRVAERPQWVGTRGAASRSPRRYHS